MYSHLKTLSKSPASIYVVLRYVTYGLQFINSILLVNTLGEYSYGIYGFILMFTVYALYFNLGLNESLNAEYALNKANKNLSSELWNTTLSFCITWYLILTLAAFATLHFLPDIFSKYDFAEYGYLLIITCVLHNISTIYATLYKLHGKTIKVNIQQLLPQIGILIIIVFGKNVASINSVVTALLATNVISLLICLINPPEKFKFGFKCGTLGLLLKRGISLLLYNLSFQLLTILALSIVSFLYSVEQMGCYSLANSITNGVIMAGGAFLYIFSPKIINKMGESADACKVLIKKFEQIYNVFIDFISIISILFVWVISKFYPDYGDTFVIIYSILVAGRIINNASTGYSTFLIAIKKEHKLVASGIISICFSAFIYWLIYIYSGSIFWIPLTIFVSSIVFSWLVISLGQLELYHKIKISQTIGLTIGQYKWMIFSMVFIYAFICPSTYVLIVGLITYVLFNRSNILNSAKSGFKIVANKQALKF